MGVAHSPKFIRYRGVAQLVARLLWAKSPTAAGGGCREGDFGARSKCGEASSEHTHFGHRKRATKAQFLVVRILKHNIISRCGAVGSALALGARCRRFKSCHLDQMQIIRTLYLSVKGSDFCYIFSIRISIARHKDKAESFYAPCLVLLLGVIVYIIFTLLLF